MTPKFISEHELQKAAAVVRSSMLATLPEEAEGDFSTEFLQQIEKLKSVRKKHQQFRKRLVAAVAAFIAAVTMLFTFNTEARAAVITWFKEVFATGAAYWFNEGSADTLPAFELTEVPEGFVCIYDEALTYSRGMVYQNADNPSELFSFRYGLLQEDSPLTVGFHGEDFTVTGVMVAGCPGDLYISGDSEESHALIWIDEQNGVVFTITMLGDPDVMLHIAESVKLVK